MGRALTLAEAQADLAQVVERAAQGETVELVRDGQVIALLVPAPPRAAETARPGLAAFIAEFRATHDLAALDTDAVFTDLRERSPGREVEL